jgi:hypothetical protein
MLQEIGSLDHVDTWIEEALAQKKKIMGIGHRVYKVLDPRAPHLKAMAVKLSEQLGERKWIQMSERIAAIMKERKGLNANVDFYSATVYYSLDIPTDLFTPIFAISRMSGWTAHILEQLADNRLFRPLSQYNGPAPGLGRSRCGALRVGVVSIRDGALLSVWMKKFLPFLLGWIIARYTTQSNIHTSTRMADGSERLDLFASLGMINFPFTRLLVPTRPRGLPILVISAGSLFLRSCVTGCFSAFLYRSLSRNLMRRATSVTISSNA